MLKNKENYDIYRDEILTVKEVAKYLKVNVHKVYELINSGQLPALKLGSLKVRRKCLEEFLDTL